MQNKNDEGREGWQYPPQERGHGDKPVKTGLLRFCSGDTTGDKRGQRGHSSAECGIWEKALYTDWSRVTDEARCRGKNG